MHTFAGMEIPKKVLKAAKYLVDMYGANFELLGDYQGSDVYMFRFPEGVETGYPALFLFKDNSVLPMCGIESLQVLASFPDLE